MYAGNPASLFKRFVAWLGGGSSTLPNQPNAGGSVSTAGSVATAPIVPLHLPSYVTHVAGQHPQGVTTGLSKKGKVQYIVPIGDLPIGTQLNQKFNPFNNSGVAKGVQPGAGKAATQQFWSTFWSDLTGGGGQVP